MIIFSHPEDFLVDAADGYWRPVVHARGCSKPEPAGVYPGAIAVGDLLPAVVVSEDLAGLMAAVLSVTALVTADCAEVGKGQDQDRRRISLRALPLARQAEPRTGRHLPAGGEARPDIEGD